MADLSSYLHGAGGDGVHWTLEGPGELNVNLVHLDAGHAMGEHANEAVDVVIVVLAGTGRLTIDGRGTALAPHVVAHVPRTSLRSVRADEHGLDYLSIHRRRGPLDLGPPRGSAAADKEAAHDQGGDPACWAHLFEDDAAGPG